LACAVFPDSIYIVYIFVELYCFPYASSTLLSLLLFITSLNHLVPSFPPIIISMSVSSVLFVHSSFKCCQVSSFQPHILQFLVLSFPVSLSSPFVAASESCHHLHPFFVFPSKVFWHLFHRPFLIIFRRS